MQAVQSADAMRSSSTRRRQWLKWSLLTVIGVLNGYATMLMYARGEIAFALLTLIVTVLALLIFGSKKMYAHRYIYPGVVGMILFILFPLVYTVGLSLTNYSAKNQLSFERAQAVLLAQTYQSGAHYPFTLYVNNEGAEPSYRMVVESESNQQNGSVTTWITPTFTLPTSPTTDTKVLRLEPTATTDIVGEKAPLKTVIAHRALLGELTLRLPNDDEIRMSGLRQFAAITPLYTRQSDQITLHNNRTGELLKPNQELGFYQVVNEQGEFVGETISPGFIVGVGTQNFERVWQDEGIKAPFISIFIWTIIFSVATVILTAVIGLVLASVVQWEALKGRAIYRVLLILPYAVPAFISILIFKGLFNQSFGEINMVLEAIFGISPAWFSDPLLAKIMVVIVNTWLGFPYMMILCMGMLKAIPDDLYEASAIDGASFMTNFTRITMPLMIKPLTPLLIASFAFNFNNFVLIQLLTAGGPNRIGISEPAGYTDLLVNYTYRIAFEGAGGQDFGLASAIATLIFFLVGALALLNLRVSKVAQD